MVRELLHILNGYFAFRKYRKVSGAAKHKVWLVLTGENAAIDRYALLHLKDYVERKVAGMAIILTASPEVLEQVNAMSFSFPVEVRLTAGQEISAMYDYYCFDENLDNLVFTYTGKGKDNLLWRILKETDINEEEAVCMGLYRLRRVPELEAAVEAHV